MPSMPKTDLKPLPAGRPTTATIALVQSSSLPMLVHKELERMILAGEIAIGAKLNEVALAERLGVSRGLVHLEKNRGVFVRQISIEEADEIYEVRAALDEWVGRRLAQTATAGQLKELKAIVERMDRAAAKNELDAWHVLNLEFHDRLVEYTANAKLLAVY